MAIPHAQPGELIDVRPLGAALSDTITHTLVKTPHLEVIRLVLPAGKELQEHKARGEITVQCLEGQVSFTSQGRTETLTPGTMLFLPTAAVHSLAAIENSSLLLTLRLAHQS